MVKCISYNCNSIRNNSEIVKELLNKTDILFLQEIMLSKSDLGLLNDFNENFECVGFVKDRESEGINEGRPSKGVAIYWRRFLSPYVAPLIIDDSLIGLILTSPEDCHNKSLFLNVYLPCDTQTSEAFDNYRSSLARLEVICREQNFNNLVIVGDFNADPFKGRFWKELLIFTKTLSLIFVDGKLPQDTFSYLCPAKDSTSWLDHIFASGPAAKGIANVSVDYNSSIYDHFPICFDYAFQLDETFIKKTGICIEKMVNWNKVNEKDKITISRIIDDLIKQSNCKDEELFYCTCINCKNPKHLESIEKIYDFIKTVLFTSTDDFTFLNMNVFKVIPGWNEYVKDLYKDARRRFLKWKSKGKPLTGFYRELMRSTRTIFKNALDFCKKNEEDIRRGKMVDSFKNKRYKQFWNEVYKVKKNNDVLPSKIDGDKDYDCIVNNFANKYKTVLDQKGNGESSARFCNLDLKDIKVGEINLFSFNDVKQSLKSLKPGIGCDSIHTNHLLYAPDSLIKLLARLFSSCVIHGYLPIDMIKGIINPLLKDSHGDISSSDNYRPVMLSSIFLKLFEYCLLKKIDPYFSFNDRQHGFRPKYSTSTACLVLKETILNYMHSGSPVYSCFIDIKKAFDSVNHKLLLEKLIKQRIPPIFVNLIKFWYSNQKVSVRFGHAMSDTFLICNGVRQGGVLSGLFFNLYIDSILHEISNMKYGCKLGITSSNIIAYADDIVLLAPSAYGLQSLINKAHQLAINLELRFNQQKTKCMVFSSMKEKCNLVSSFTLEGEPIQFVTSFRYLGFIVQYNLKNNEDIDNARGTFYREFNCLLRKFHFVGKDVLLYLFKQYCLQLYGAELWISDNKSAGNLRQFAIGYHKAIKKILKVSTHESNHYVCQEAGLHTFEHFINKKKIFAGLRFMTNPCDFIVKTSPFLTISSFLYREIYAILRDAYGIESLLENDKDALISRIAYVQNHEAQLRTCWD